MNVTKFLSYQHKQVSAYACNTSAEHLKIYTGVHIPFHFDNQPTTRQIRGTGWAKEVIKIFSAS